MTSINKSKFIRRTTLVLTKAFEVIHWIGTATMAALGIGSIAAKQWLQSIFESGVLELGTELNTYGFEMTVANSAEEVNMTAILLFSIATVIIFSLEAMVFRNIYLITKKSQDATPFQPDNIRMLKEIGIFSISVPVVGLVMSTICRLVLGVDAVETSVNMYYGFSMGIIVLCLTQFFAHGAELEKDVDGLL